MANNTQNTDPTTQKIHGIPLLTEPVQQALNRRQQVDYAEERCDLLQWLINLGKDPEHGDGYSVNTVEPRSYRIDQFYRWVWKEHGGYTTELTHEYADRYTKVELAYGDKSNVHNNNCLKALKMLYKWRRYERGGEEWDSEMTFKSEQNAPRDYLRKEERRKIRQASLEYGSIPSYHNLDAGQRDKWKAHLAQRFEKPKNEVGPSDWERANGWKIPSLIYVSLDTGLRPVEVENAKKSWVDLDNGELRIPAKESAKNRENWNPVLTQKTQQILGRWLQERENYDKYDDTDRLWLTREANPYQTSALKYLLTRLAEEAGMETENRSFHWYMIRHSTGTYTTHEISGRAAVAQIRSEIAPEKYDQVSPELRRKGLEEIG